MSGPTRETAAARAYLDLQNRARAEARGTQELLTLYVVERWLARLSMFMEHVAMALNPAQMLMSGKRAVGVVAAAGITAVIDGLEAKFAATEHAVYETRRIMRPCKDDVTKMANAARSVTAIAAGTREQMRTDWPSWPSKWTSRPRSARTASASAPARTSFRPWSSSTWWPRPW